MFLRRCKRKKNGKRHAYWKYNRQSCSEGKIKRRRIVLRLVHQQQPTTGRKNTPPMRGFMVRGSSCPSDRKQSRRRDRQNEIEAARSEAVASAVAEDTRGVLDAHVREGARKLMSTAGGLSSATATSRLEAS